MVMPDAPDFPAYSQISLKQLSYFNTVRVTADVHWRLVRSALPCGKTGEFDVPVLVRSQFLYILLRVEQEPVFLINSR